MSRLSRTVRIYGSGIAGAALARQLCKDCDVTIVDPLDFFEVPMSAPRSLVRPSFAEQAIIPLSVALPGVTHVQARLVEWTAQGGRIEDARGDSIVVGADVSVLATGSRFSNPLMRSTDGTARDRKAFYHHFNERLKASERILIVGGGPIGIEVAGEISEAFPKKQITIVEAGERILGGTSQRLSEHAKRVLEARGVAIHVNERLVAGPASGDDVFAPPGEAVTDQQRSIRYDLLIWCVGGRPNTGYLRAQHAHVLDHAGRIMVDADLSVKGEPRLFALGDITDLAENKMAMHIQGQVKVAEANIRAVLAKPPASLKTYRPKTGVPTMVVTLGSREGVAHLPPFGPLTARWLTRALKANHMLVPMYRKQFGLSKAIDPGETDAAVGQDASHGLAQ